MVAVQPAFRSATVDTGSELLEKGSCVREICPRLRGEPSTQPLKVLGRVNVPPARQDPDPEPLRAGARHRLLEDLRRAPGDAPEELWRRLSQPDEIVSAVFARTEDPVDPTILKAAQSLLEDGCRQRRHVTTDHDDRPEAEAKEVSERRGKAPSEISRALRDEDESAGHATKDWPRRSWCVQHSATRPLHLSYASDRVEQEASGEPRRTRAGQRRRQTCLHAPRSWGLCHDRDHSVWRQTRLTGVARAHGWSISKSRAR
jgi:hypothetical protein